MLWHNKNAHCQAECRPRRKVPYCRPGIPAGLRQSVSKAPSTGGSAVQVIPGTVSPLMVPDTQGMHTSGVLPDRLLLPSTTSAGRCRWVESHSDLDCYRVLGMRSVKNGKLFEDIPARSFCRLAKHALHPVKQVRRVRPTGTARHGSVVYRHRPARVCCL
jgi:hypothetical protein